MEKLQIKLAIAIVIIAMLPGMIAKVVMQFSAIPVVGSVYSPQVAAIIESVNTKFIYMQIKDIVELYVLIFFAVYIILETIKKKSEMLKQGDAKDKNKCGG